MLNTAYNRVHVPRATVFGTLNIIDIESTEVSNISWIKMDKSKDDIRNSPMELPKIPWESSFQPEHNNTERQLVILQDTQAPQEARDSLPSLLENEFDIISKSSTDVGRTNLFKMDIPTTRSPIACKPYPAPSNSKKC